MSIHAVTGAFGFSGQYITRRLLNAGKTVITLTNSPNRRNPFNRQVEARPYRFDDVQAMAEELRGVDVFYNTYWVRFNHDDFNHKTAVHNTLLLFEAAKQAGVKRFVHVSITNPDENSPLEYFRGKGRLERALRESGLSYAVLRPAVLFGPEDILINNIAWTLRKFPIFAVFGNGQYHIQPIYADDLAKLAVEQGENTENVVIEAVGPEDFTYLKLVETMCEILGLKRRILHMPPALGLLASQAVGKAVNDVFVTKEEIDGLMADTLHAPGAEPAGTTRLTDWLREHKDSVGKRYANELARRKDRTKAYLL